jgi:non-catalytic primase subunit PriX-like protein
LPIDIPILEQLDEYGEFEQPSQGFLKYAEDALSTGGADSSHSPSFKSCLLRIPGSLNKKCLDHGKDGRDAQVRIIQKWNGKRGTPSKHFMTHYRIYLRQQKIGELERQKKAERYFKMNSGKYGNNNNNGNSCKINWIETLLQTPIGDYRKQAVDLIIAPYLIIVRRLSQPDVSNIINLWLDKCDEVERFDFRSKDRIGIAIRNVYNKNIPPMKLATLEKSKPELYHKIQSKMKESRYGKASGWIM